jgi:hypothetical protein
MAQAPQPIAAAPALDTTVNCCNGRVGKRMLDMAAENETIAALVRPTGVDLLREAGAALAAKDTVNCCNGRVGKELDAKEISLAFNE